MLYTGCMLSERGGKAVNLSDDFCVTISKLMTDLFFLSECANGRKHLFKIIKTPSSFLKPQQNSNGQRISLWRMFMIKYKDKASIYYDLYMIFFFIWNSNDWKITMKLWMCSIDSIQTNSNSSFDPYVNFFRLNDFSQIYLRIYLFYTI